MDEAERVPAHVLGPGRGREERRRGRRHREVDRRQDRLDLGAMGLVLRRQLELFAESLDRLVDCEARRIGGELEQNAARLAKVYGMEVIAIDHRRRMEAGSFDGAAHRELRCIVRHPKSDVMHGPRAADAAGEAADGAHVDERPRTVIACRVAPRGLVVAHWTEPKRVGEHALAACRVT